MDSMNLKSRIFTRLKYLWEQNLFKYAVIINLFYFVLSIILFFLLYSEKNDFMIFYQAGDLFLNDINNLYNQTNYLWDFRYFPLSALIFIPFSILNIESAFIVFNVFNIFLNILICFFAYKIIIMVRYKDHEVDDKRVIKYICIYLMGLPHVLNYIYGQINLYITFFILISLYIFIKYQKFKWQFLASLILGMSIIIKPTSFFLIPFLIIFQFDIEKKKFNFDLFTTLGRLVGAVIPVSLNFILFFMYPSLWNGFLNTNFTGSNPTALNFSFSISKLITNFCYFFNISFNQLYVLIGVICVVGILGFIIYVLRRFEKNSIIYGYALGIVIMLLAYYDSWDHHLLNLTPVLIIIIFNLPRQSEIGKSIKSSLFFFSFFDLMFLGIWYLIYPLFPFNFGSTFFLILTFYAIGKYCLRRKQGESVEG
ncbi:MAG: glycosyltransferase family 87 protein [Candidatus Thorarchaeota archaeon]